MRAFNINTGVEVVIKYLPLLLIPCCAFAGGHSQCARYACSQTRW